MPFVADLGGEKDGDFLTEEVVAPLRDYLTSLAEDSAARRDVAGKTVAGAVGSALQRVDALAALRERQENFANQLNEAVHELYVAANRHVIQSTSDGKLLRSEVMDRWQDVVGTSDVFRGFERWFSQAVDKVGSFFTGQPAPLREVETEIETGLHAVIVDAAERAAGRAWSHIGSVAPELRADADPSLSRASADISQQASQLVRDWQEDMVQRIQDTAGDKRQRARVMSFGLNVVSVALMLAVFASTAGITGGEVAIASGSAVVGQKLLETIFGEDTVRRMVAQAREDLNRRLGVLFAAERDRYRALTEPLLEGATADELRTASESAKRATDTRLLGITHTPAETAQLPAPQEDVTESFEHGTLRGLFDQLRGTFGTGGADV